MKVDAAVLIGDKGKSLPVQGENKNFLQLNGLPLFFYVLRALEKSKHVNQIFIVGNKGRIQTSINKNIQYLKCFDRITLLQQKTNLLENSLMAFQKAREFDGDKNLTETDKPLLYLPGDAPLIRAQEIDEFIEQCDLTQYDYFLGISRKEGLLPFSPSKTKRGIKMACFYLKGLKIRHNNIHLAKPLKIKNLHYIQRIYDYRYQKEPVNFLRLLWEFYRTNVKIKKIYYYLILHCNSFLSRLGLDSFTFPFRQLISLEKIEKAIGDTLGCRFKTVETKLTGAAIDVDNGKDYETMKIMFDQWQEYQDCRSNSWKII